MNSIDRERATRRKALDLLEEEGWGVWYPVRPGGKWKFKSSSTDIFGLFDLICIPKMSTILNGVSVRFIQLKSNHKGRIDPKYFDEGFLTLPRVTCEYWSFQTKARTWKRVILKKGKNYLRDYAV